MKNIIYGGIIAISIIVVLVVFVLGGSDDAGSGLSDEEQVRVLCLRCNTSYEMGKKSFYEELSEKTRANPTPMMMTPPLTCRECGQDGIVKAVKCEKCGEIFREGSVPNDHADRCPKCNYSATEASREARRKGLSQ
jgi:predicted Zn-ribbon and HTH transcriptional regulator